MTATTIRVQMAQRKDTAANWTAANPILLSGEIGYETDTKKFKIGNGSTNWNSLAYLPIPDGSGNLTITGNLEIGSTGSLTFEGSTADGFETTLAVTNPTADRTITLPNQSGNVLVSGNASIIDADIAANAEIAVSKLADGTARQLLQTDAAGTGVEWTSNVDIPGTLDVTGAATFDAAVTVAGDLTVNGTTTTISTQNLLVEDKNIIIGDVASPTDVTADGGGITLKGATDKTINWVDATDAWTSSERFSVPLGTAALPSLTFTGDPNTGIYSPGADQVAISTNSSGRLFIDANGNVGINTASTIAPGGFGYAREFALTGATSGDSSAAINIRGSRTVSGGFGDINFWHQSTSNRAYIQARRGSSDSAIDLDFITSGGAGMRITSAGLVGVGTSSPGARLHVGTASLSGNWSGFFGDNLGSAIAPPANYGLALGYNRSGGSGEANIAYGTGTGVGFGLVFASYDGTNYTNRVTFDGAGRVGIGTTSPVELLHVAGNAQIGAATGAAAIEVGVGATGNRPAYIDFVGDTTYADYGLRVIREDTGANANSALYHRGTGALVFNAVDSGPFLFFHNNAERARIDSSGRLLVGTSSDSGGALFQVNGDRIRVGTAKTPASATDTGIAGEICWDASYVYVCTATNTWKRSALSTW